jgi:uncharacterized membrane protein
MWSGTAASYVDLNPTGYASSIANAVDGAFQVGAGGQLGQFHAVMWNGSASSVVDLHPVGNYIKSEALAISGNTQGGTATVPAIGQLPDVPHAFIWHGTAASGVDLNPFPFLASSIDGVSAAGQVGYASSFDPGPGLGDPPVTGPPHAFYWNGTLASAVDLHASVVAQLGPTYIGSRAFGINDDGSIVGFAYETPFNFRAVLWTPAPLPEPASSAMLIGALWAVTACRRRWRAEDAARR